MQTLHNLAHTHAINLHIPRKKIYTLVFNMYTHEIFTFQDPTEMEKAAQKKAAQSSGSNVVGELSHTHTAHITQKKEEKKQKSTLKYIKKHFTISINKSNIF